VEDAPDIERAVSSAAALDGDSRRVLYGRAVAHGAANTQCSAERERRYGTLRLLTLATLRVPDLAVYGELLHAHAAEGSGACVVARTLVDASSGAMRLAYRALEVHSRELGYCAQAWVDRALDGAGGAPQGSEEIEGSLPVALDQARLAAISLTRATASTANDPMLVPGQIADALGHLLAIYLIGVALVAGE
jgi:hypothetical protein